jgi:hypothetical protein
MGAPLVLLKGLAGLKGFRGALVTKKGDRNRGRYWVGYDSWGVISERKILQYNLLPRLRVFDNDLPISIWGLVRRRNSSEDLGQSIS